MADNSSVQKAYQRFHATLQASAAGFNLLVVGSVIITVVVAAMTGMLGGIGFFFIMAVFAVGMYYAHKVMMKDPLYAAIDHYLQHVNESKLSGDALLQLRALPTKQNLRRFSKYSIALQRSSSARLFKGLRHLTFTGELNQIEEPYQETVKLIRG